MHTLFWSILNSMFSYCFNLHIVGKLLTFHFCNGNFVQFWVELAKLWAFEGMLSFLQLISRQRSTFSYSEISSYLIFLIYTWLKSCWNCTSFGGSFPQFWVVLAGWLLFEGWLSSRSLFQNNNLLFAHFKVNYAPILFIYMLLENHWNNASLGNSFAQFLNLLLQT